MTLRESILQAETALAERETPSPHPKLDAELLLLFTLGREGDRAYLLTHLDLVLDCAPAARYCDLIAQRSTGKPLQYITGHQEFFGLDFLVTPAVLIPRPETEHAVEAALDLLRQSQTARPRILDVGTGSGCIAIAIAHAFPNAQTTAVDLSPEALSVARENAVRHHLQIEFLESDLLAAVADQKFDLIISNPPYIATDHPDTVQRQVRDFEPALALWGGATGLEIYTRLIPQAHTALSPGGHLVLEIGYSLAPAVRAIFSAADWQHLKTIPDLQGIPRVITAQKR